MNQEEMKTAYMNLYDYMANSKKPENMKAFGKVMTKMMNEMIATAPQKAEEYIEELSSIHWNQFLTKKEAEKIVANMQPKAPWSRDVWSNAMDSLGLQKEEEPYYNSCALWTVMNQVYTDHAKTIADNIIKKPLAEIPAEQLVPGIRALALDLLKDVDGKYNVRTYFGL